MEVMALKETPYSLIFDQFIEPSIRTISSIRDDLLDTPIPKKVLYRLCKVFDVSFYYESSLGPEQAARILLHNYRPLVGK